MDRPATIVGALASLSLALLIAKPPVAVAQSGSPSLESDSALFIPLGSLPGGSEASAAFGMAVVESDEEVATQLPSAQERLEELGIEIRVVGESSSSATGSNAREAFYWASGSGMQGLGSLAGGAFRSQATAISLDGGTLAGASSSASSGANGLEAFLADSEGVWQLGDLSGGRFQSEAFDVSPYGEYAVGASSSRYSGSNSAEAFMWSEEDGIQGLGSLSGGQFRSAALAISDDGVVVVGWSSSSRTGANSAEAFVWTGAEGMWGLGSLDGGQFRSEARDVSYDGSVVVGGASSRRSGSNASEAFIWSEDTGMQGLGFLPGGFADSEATAVTQDGEVVVGRSTTSSRNDAFVWQQEYGMLSVSDILTSEGLDMRGWRLLSATDVEMEGALLMISGTGLSPRQREEAWVAVLGLDPASVPEPAAGAAQAAALLALLVCRRVASRARR